MNIKSEINPVVVRTFIFPASFSVRNSILRDIALNFIAEIQF